MTKTIDLSKYDNSWYHPGSNSLKRIIWYFVNACFFNCGWNVFNGLKIFLLKSFGAKVGQGVVVKPNVNIKYPWNLVIGDYCWIGEEAWIDNLAKVILGDNVVISQGALLLCGNHDYKKSTFDLRIGDITIDDGAWIGAKSVVCPGVTIHSHCVLTVGSIATKDCMPFSIYQGNPALKIKDRIISD